jgi:TP901 family phage tail tape measure protein
MALTGKNIDLVLGLKLNEFFRANKRATAAYSKTKGAIEKKPIRIKSDGAKQLLTRLTQIGAAYIGIRKVFTDLTTSQTNLANIASLGVDNIEEIADGIQQIGQDVPVALHDIEEGMYQVVSAGVATADQIDVLRLSAQAAKAGLAETNDALNLGAAVIKGYGLEFSEFETVMDQAFQTVKLGQTTFPELASSIGAVVPLASTLKVETQELFGAFATLTGVTGSTSEVATQLRGILAATAKPTADLTALFEDYGGAAKALQELGLAEYLKVIADETGGNTEKMAKLIPRVEGLNAVLALSGPQFDTFVEKTQSVDEAVGAMGDAFDIQADTIDSQITKLDNSFQVFSQSILKGVVPAITTVIELGNSFFQWFTDLEEGSQKALLGLTGLSVVLVKLPALLRAVQLAIAGLNASLGPAGWLILGLGAFAAVVIKAHDNMVKLNEQFDKLNAGIKELSTEAIVQELLELEEELNKKRADGVLITVEEAEKLDFLRKAVANRLKDENEGIDLTAKKYKLVNGELVEIKETLDEISTGTTRTAGPLDPEAVERAMSKITDISLAGVERIREINLEFEGLTSADLEAEFLHRSDLFDRYLDITAAKWGTQSQRYKDLLEQRLELDRNYQQQRTALEEQAVADMLSLGATLMSGFQGQSQAFFEIGKVAAIAEATVNAYKGASESLAAYPMPFAAVISAIHLAAGLAQIDKISSVKFQKAKGRAEGGAQQKCLVLFWENLTDRAVGKHIKPAALSTMCWRPEVHPGTWL